MKKTKIIVAASAALALLLSGSALAQQGKPQQPEPPQSPTAPTEFKPLDSDQVKKIPAPSEEPRKSGAEMTPRERLARFVGTWNVQGQVWVAPGADPMPANGTAISEWALEELFVHTRYKGETMGESFVGVGYDTWNEARQKHIGVWMDSEGTEIYSFEGDWDESGNVLTLYGKQYDAEKKKFVKTRAVATFRSSSMYTYEASYENEAGEWVKSMDAIFGRLK
jgi:hypothetical protein